MTGLNLPRASCSLLTLQCRLSRCRAHYPLTSGHAWLSACPLPTTLDCTINLNWRGLALQAHCHATMLANWLIGPLQEAAFTCLPYALQLALLQEQASLLQGLALESIMTSAPEPAEHSLLLTLTDGERLLPLWLQGDLSGLIDNLPRKPLDEWLSVPLDLALQWPIVELPLTLLRTLATGDVLLLPSSLQDVNHLQGHIQGKPWMTLNLIDSQLEIITMLEASPLEFVGDITELEQLPIQVSFEIGRHTLDLQTLATLQPGSLIDLQTPLVGEVRILAGQRCIGTGELVNIEDRFGVRVKRLLSDVPA